MRFFAAPERVFSPQQFSRWEVAAERLVAGEPIQYITGRAWFHDLELRVGPGVLIPRPETAELVDWVVADAKPGSTDILDIGTGSGCIAVSLAVALPEANVTGIDLSEEALHFARINAGLFAPRVLLLEKDILAAAPNGLPLFDVIVSNPPYIPYADAEEMPEQVLQHEPGLALFVPDNDPLMYYIKVADFSLNHLKPGGRLYFEIHESFGKEVSRLLGGSGFEEVELRKDIFGKDRMVSARLAK